MMKKEQIPIEVFMRIGQIVFDRLFKGRKTIIQKYEWDHYRWAKDEAIKYYLEVKNRK